MATYKIKGQRFIRKYTEPQKSPVYATRVQAQAIVDSFCDVPWERTEVKSARMSYHTEEAVDESKVSGLDKNVEIRDGFDAALFCAEHGGGLHRAFANAAVYCYKMPNSAIGKKITTLTMRVTSDPYNSEGVRLHIFTNDTGEIPMNCNTLRGNNAQGVVIEDGTTAAGVVKRVTEVRGGTDYWYPNIESVTLTPASGMVIQKYVFVLVALESYSTVRGNWLEGSAFITNDVEIVTSAAVTDFKEDEVNDLSDTDTITQKEIPIRVVCNEDAKGKLWVQAVIYNANTFKVLNKWSFDCDFKAGQRETVVMIPNNSKGEDLLTIKGSVRLSRTELVVDGIFFEAWIGNENYDVKNLYGCDNLREDHSIELTKTSAIFARINPFTSACDRKELLGGDCLFTSESEYKFKIGNKLHIRIERYKIIGSLQINDKLPYVLLDDIGNFARPVNEFDIDENRPFITEANFLQSIDGDKKFDIFFDEFYDFAIDKDIKAAVGNIVGVMFRIIIGSILYSKNEDGSSKKEMANEEILVERRFYTTALYENPSIGYINRENNKIEFGAFNNEAYRPAYNTFWVTVFGKPETFYHYRISTKSIVDGVEVFTPIYLSSPIRLPVTDFLGRYKVSVDVSKLPQEIQNVLSDTSIESYIQIMFGDAKKRYDAVDKISVWSEYTRIPNS